MKKVFSIVLILSLIAACFIVFSGCGKQNKQNGNENTGNIESGGEIVGGWTTAASPVITDDLKQVFEQAVAKLDGVVYTPVAYLASQVVAGMNHCVLCKRPPVSADTDAKTTYSIAYIYEDPEGNAEMTEIVDSEADAQYADNNVAGGWSENESLEMTDDARTAFEKATETLTGAEYTPVALLATQIVAGINYRIICGSRPAVPDPECGYAIVTIYADREGNAKITDTIEFRHREIYQGDPEESETTNAGTKAAVDGNIKTYYEMNDGTWMCDGIIYKYRLEIKGRMPNAAVDSTFVYLSNIEEISFEQAYKAAGVSSSTEDYFSPEEAVLVEMS